MASKAYLGVAFGNNSLKLAQTNKEEKVTRTASVALPDGIMKGGRINAWSAASEFLHDVVKKEGFSAKHVAIVLPEEAVYQRRTVLPLMNTQVLMTNLPYEFRDFISDDKDNYIYDYSVVDRNAKEMTLNAVAVSKREMERVADLCRGAGLRLVQAIPRSCAISNLFHQIAPDIVKNDFAVLDLGAYGTRIDIYSHGFYQVTRTLETGGNAIRDQIARELGIDSHIAEVRLRENQGDVLGLAACEDLYSTIAVDIMHAINYYAFENHDNTLETMYYFGGNAHNGYLMQEIANIVPLELLPLSELRMSYCMDGEALVSSATAIGAAWNKEFYPNRTFSGDEVVKLSEYKELSGRNAFAAQTEDESKRGGSFFGRRKK